MRVALPVIIRLLSALLAVALIALGVIAVIEVVGAWLGVDRWVLLPDDTSERLRTWRWDDTATRWTIFGLAVAALVSLLMAFWKRAPMTVPVAGRPNARYERHALERAIAADVDDVEGIDRVDVTVGDDRIGIRADSHRRHAIEQVREAVNERVVSSLAQRRVQLPPRVDVSGRDR